MYRGQQHVKKQRSVLCFEDSKEVIADHFSIVVYQVCWHQLQTVCQHMFRNCWQYVGGVVRGEI